MGTQSIDWQREIVILVLLLYFLRENGRGSPAGVKGSGCSISYRKVGPLHGTLGSTINNYLKNDFHDRKSGTPTLIYNISHFFLNFSGFLKKSFYPDSHYSQTY